MRLFLAALLACSLGFGGGYAWMLRLTKAGVQMQPEGAKMKVDGGPPAVSPSATGAPERLMAALRFKDDPLRMEHELWLALQSLKAEDVNLLSAEWADVTALLRQIKIPEDSRNALADALMEKWLALDAPGALGRFRELAAKPWSYEIAGAIRVLADKHPDALLEFALAEKNKEHRKLCAWEVLLKTGERDFARALAMVERFPEEERKELAFGARLGRAKAEPLAGLAMAVKEKDEVFRCGLFNIVGGGLAERGRGEIALALAQHPECTGASTYYFLYKLTERDPAGVAEIISESPASRWHPSLFGQIARRYAERDPHAAMEWAGRLTGKERSESERAIATLWAETNPKAALEWFISHPPVPFAESDPREWRKDARSQAFETWMFTDESSARQWLEQQPDNEAAQLARRVHSSHLRNSGRDEEAADILGPTLSAKDAGEIGYSFAFKEPNRAAEWALALPSGDAQNTAIGAVIGRWTRQDRDAAEQWLETFPEGAARDAAIRGFAVNAADKSPDTASARVVEIEDRWQRTQAARDVYSAWRRRDPAAAREWFTSVPGIYETLRAESLAWP